MSSDGSFRVEDFLDALTSQLDRTQDALRLKAVNRPLTYAIRDFSLDLHVFVEMDEQGQVRFRSTGPNDSGASTVSIGFTTITRPMIMENTITLSEVQSPSLGELGLAPEEQRSLEKIGVRNAAQLKRLNTSSGEGALARFANVPVNRLRAALQAGSPQVDRLAPMPSPQAPRVSGSNTVEHGQVNEPSVPSVRIPRGTRRLKLDGKNLGELGTTGLASLGDAAIPIIEAKDDYLIVDLGNVEPRGRLEIAVDGLGGFAFQLETETDGNDDSSDPWSPA